MNKALMIIGLVFLAGCSDWVNFDPKDLDQAKDKCANNGGLQKIRVVTATDTHDLEVVRFWCGNGMRGDYKRPFMK